jgi:hypothetical protein
VGDDPYRLEGVSISAMPDYGTKVQPGPEGAVWKTVHSYEVSGALYRFGACGSGATCLEVSTDGGKTWKPVSRLFETPQFANPFFISIRPAHEAIVLGMSAGKPGEHVYAVSFVATRDGTDTYIMGRVPEGEVGTR